MKLGYCLPFSAFKWFSGSVRGVRATEVQAQILRSGTLGVKARPDIDGSCRDFGFTENIYSLGVFSVERSLAIGLMAVWSSLKHAVMTGAAAVAIGAFGGKPHFQQFADRCRPGRHAVLVPKVID